MPSGTVFPGRAEIKMNLMTANFFAAARRWLVAGLLALVLGSRASAQSEQPERWLFM